MIEIIRNLHALANAFYARQANYVAAHPGDEDVLLRRLYGSTAPRYLDILGIMTQFDPRYGAEDLRFLIKSFAQSLSSIEQASADVQTAFFYNAFDQFLRDVENVLQTGLLAWQHEKPSAELGALISRKEPLLEFA